MILSVTLLVGVFLAYANGANDNFKGVATLFGSKLTGYRTALAWAAISTLLGSLASLTLASSLVASFSGKGLVPAPIMTLPSFPLAVGLAAAATVLLATRLGFPISTTHALVGGLVGAGIIASPTGINLSHLLHTFLLPLLISPLLAIAGMMALYPTLKSLAKWLGLHKERCLCIGRKVVGVVPTEGIASQALAQTGDIDMTVGTNAECVERYQGRVIGVNVGSALDALHFLSAGAVGFARGLNDTPKIAAILLVGSMFDQRLSITAVAIVMAAGGIISAKQVAHKMSLDITTMHHAHGCATNLLTSFLVIFASRWGLPVSTTHVSCGALFGMGTAGGRGDFRTMSSIAAGWVITLPVAALLSALFFLILNGHLS